MDLGFSHLIKSTQNSLAGLVTAWKGEQAFRHECLVFIVLGIMLWETGKTPGEWLLALGAWLAVMAVELLNSAVEKTCDLVTKEFHPLIKAAKDMASAAIFLAIAGNVGLWAYLFLL